MSEDKFVILTGGGGKNVCLTNLTDYFGHNFNVKYDNLQFVTFAAIGGVSCIFRS